MADVRMTRGRVQRELGAALFALGVLLAIVLAAAVWISHDLESGARRAYVRQAIPTKSAALDLVVQLVNEATGVRAFVGLGSESSLAPYRMGVRGVERDLAMLEGSRLGGDVERTRRQVMALEHFYARQVALARSGPAGRREAARRLDRGRVLFNDFRDGAAGLAARTDAFVAQTASDQRDRYRALLLVLGLVGAAALAIAAALVVIVPRRAGQLLAERAALLDHEREGRETLDRVLALTPRFLDGAAPDDVPERVCEAAVEAFGCASASLWLAEGGDLRLAARSGEPEAPNSTALDVPVAVGGRLALRWDEGVEPSRALRDAAQRFGDQVGLAVEQARRRRAQAEATTLNRTLQRMVSTDPLFLADGTVREVGEAICAAACRVFHSAAAALWVEHGGRIELAHRTPPTPTLPVGVALDGERFPGFAADLKGRRPRFLADVEHEEPDVWQEIGRHSGAVSQLRLPLGGAGIIVLSWTTRVDPPSAEEQAVAARFAGQAAVALAEAERREASRAAERLHEQLERRLLPTLEVADPRVRVAAFYRAGDERLSLGGDFYDCVELDDRSIAMIIGDVSGHGPSAAALGASLRSAWRALALAGGGPVEQLDGLERLLIRERQAPEMFVTALAGVIAADRASIALSAAGHPPPLLIGGEPAHDTPGAPPLGVKADSERPLVRLALGSPATIVLYTDGLIEGRARADSPERFGVERVEGLLAAADPGGVDESALAGLVDAATTAHGTGLPDDVALLAVNLTPAGWSGTWPAEIESVPELREEVERYARSEGLDEEGVHAVKLAVAELAANAVVHGFVGRALPGRLTIRGHRTADALHVTVTDDGNGLRPRSDSPGLGLGLAMIAQLADGLDIDTPPSGGTVVRLRFRVSPEGSRRP